MDVVRVYRRGVIVLPKSVLERAGIREGMLLTVEARDGEVVLRPLDLWERVWGSGKGSAEEVESELDEEEEAREKRLNPWRR